MSVRDLPRASGRTIPRIGFGVFQIPDDDAQRLTEIAFEAGYRHIDTATAYGNEAGVGRAIRQSGLSRDDLHVTTKLWNTHQGYEPALRACDRSLEWLGLDFLDAYLIHFPAPARMAIPETWRAFETLHGSGVARTIGVSNFKFPYLQRLPATSEIRPAVHQIEVHPTYQQPELEAMSTGLGMVVEAYSPLGRGADLNAPAIVTISERLSARPAQVILAWHCARGRVPLPKSATPERIVENFAATHLELTTADLEAIEALEAGLRTGEDVETFN